MSFLEKLAAPVIGGVLSLVGGERGNDASADISSANNAFNAEQAALNRDFQHGQAGRTREWQQEMRATQYQTAVKDMQAAGLNPMLAYSQGGAGNLSGATATGTAASSAGNPTMRDSVTPAVTTALQAQTVQAALGVQHATEDKLQAEANEVRARTKGLYGDPDTGDKGKNFWEINHLKKGADLLFQNQLTDATRGLLYDAQEKLTRIEWDLTKGRISETQAHTQLMRVRTQLETLGLDKERAYSNFYKSDMGKAEPYYRSALDGIGSAASAARNYSIGKSLNHKGIGLKP